MRYELGKISDKDDEYLTFLDELFRDVSSWVTLHMIYDDEMRECAIEIKRIFESKDVRPFVYEEGMEDKFESSLNYDDCLLVLCFAGNEFIENMVRIAKANKVKVYGVCGDSQSQPASLFDEVLVILGDFEDYMDLFIRTFRGKFLPREPRPIIDPGTPGSQMSSSFGFVTRINVKVGDKVKKGDCLFSIEAMKMENDVCSDVDGVVRQIFIKLGDRVDYDDVVMIIR